MQGYKNIWFGVKQGPYLFLRLQLLGKRHGARVHSGSDEIHNLICEALPSTFAFRTVKQFHFDKHFRQNLQCVLPGYCPEYMAGFYFDVVSAPTANARGVSLKGRPFVNLK